MTTRQLKQALREVLLAGDMDSIVEMFQKDQRVLSGLLGLSYDKTKELTWRAIRTYGFLVARMAETDMETARAQLRRLLWMLTEESGNLGWSTIEMITETICHRPKGMEDLVLLIPQYAEEHPFVESVLYALWRLTECLGRLPWPEDTVREVLSEAGERKEPEVRGYFLLACGKIRHYMEVGPMPEDILKDEREFSYFDGEKMIRTTLKAMAESLCSSEGAKV
ncbi:MAG: hypothetical protein D6778_01135 [Nitrospirae bacterium]|nr:MAG: hypothetical protein D6778_01135 [Nitrospirota bacterium]